MEQPTTTPGTDPRRCDHCAAEDGREVHEVYDLVAGSRLLCVFCDWASSPASHDDYYDFCTAGAEYDD